MPFEEGSKEIFIGCRVIISLLCSALYCSILVLCFHVFIAIIISTQALKFLGELPSNNCVHLTQLLKNVHLLTMKLAGHFGIFK